MPWDTPRSLTYGRPPVTRTYYLHLPAGYDARRAYPLVLTLHGSGGQSTPRP